MSEDQESGSSSGMVIGMIVGGVVVLALIVLVVLGGAVFWTFEARGPVGGPVAPAPVMVAEKAPPPGPVAPGPGGPVVEPGGPAPAIQVEKPREHLIGVWEAKTKDGGVAIMEFREDGTLHMTNKSPGKADLTEPAVRWEVRTAKDGFIKLKIDTVKGEPNDHVVRFFFDNRMEIETMQGRVYERRKQAR